MFDLVHESDLLIMGGPGVAGRHRHLRDGGLCLLGRGISLRPRRNRNGRQARMILVDEKRCNGCPGHEEPCCVRACPRAALRTRLPFSLAGAGASLLPKVNGDHIKRICTDGGGNREEFVLKRREL